MRRLSVIARDIASAWRPLPPPLRPLVEQLKHVESIKAGWWGPGEAQTDGRALVRELVRCLDPASDRQKLLMGELMEALK